MTDTDYNALNRETVFDALAAIQAKKASAEYSGESDEGQIDNVTITGFAEESIATDPEIPLYATDGAIEGERRPVKLTDGIEELCWQLLESRHACWEISEGGFGIFEFDVVNRVIKLTHNERFTDYTTSEETF